MSFIDRYPVSKTSSDNDYCASWLQRSIEEDARNPSGNRGETRSSALREGLSERQDKVRGALTEDELGQELAGWDGERRGRRRGLIYKEDYNHAWTLLGLPSGLSAVGLAGRDCSHTCGL